MDRKVWAFALAGAAAVVVVDEGVITDARIVLSGVATVPWRARAAEQALIGAKAGPEAFAQAAEIAATDAVPLAHNGYKMPLVTAMVRRALAEAGV
jgi:xanthine dehydrogenase YagS FAD-binding subunit